MKLEWQNAPVKTQWGDCMRECLVELDKDSTLRLFADVDDLHKVESALLRELLDEPVQESSPLAGTMAEQFLQVVASIWHDHPDYSIRQTLDALNAKFPAEPVQDTPPQRPPTPVGWSDTDWLAHLSTMPPIAYALRDTLYGTSKAGVLRFCAANEPGAFAVYTHPPQQRKPLTDDEALALIRATPQEDVTQEGWIRRQRLSWVRAIERAITGEPT
jgi:hypothetical protein